MDAICGIQKVVGEVFYDAYCTKAPGHREHAHRFIPGQAIPYPPSGWAEQPPALDQKWADRRRVAVSINSKQIIRGRAIVSDINGPFALRFLADDIQQAVTLDTGRWVIHWESDYDEGKI